MAYNDADRPLGQAMALLKGRKLRREKPQDEVNAGIGCTTFGDASGLRGISAQMPSTEVLARIV